MINEFNAIDDRILDGMAEILWATAWADHVEECGCQSLAGCEITDVMPRIPTEARDLAYRLASAVVDKHGMTLSELYERACKADREEGYKVGTPERFGNCIAWEAMGHGVSYSDDHATCALLKYVHVDNYDLMQHAEDECGCMNLDVHVRSSDEWVDDNGKCYSEPGEGRVNTVYLDVYANSYRQAKAWADKHQSADGSYWETARDLGGLVYNIVHDRPTLVDDLKDEGYSLDLSEYTPDD